MKLPTFDIWSIVATIMLSLSSAWIFLSIMFGRTSITIKTAGESQEYYEIILPALNPYLAGFTLGIAFCSAVILMIKVTSYTNVLDKSKEPKKP